MLEKLEDPRFTSISKPSKHALDLLERVLEANPAPVVCEVGIGIGATSVEMCRLLDNRGVIHFFDFQEKLDELKADLDAAGFYNTAWTGNSRRTFDSYSWTLARMLRECRTLQVDGLFDFVFLDGAHSFHHDAPAALALKDLLKPGGYLLFDDYDWTFKISPTMNPDVNPAILEQYSDDQIAVPHVRTICEVFFDGDPRWEKVDIGYGSLEHRRAYRKLAAGEAPVARPAAPAPAPQAPATPAPAATPPAMTDDGPAGAPAAAASKPQSSAKHAPDTVPARDTATEAAGPVLMFGTFDVQTFGDLLFPIIARDRLSERGLSITAVAPLGGGGGWTDTVSSISFEDAPSVARSASAILIGGGNIVHFGPANLADYRAGSLFDRAYPTLWLGASLLGAVHNKQVLWNAPGVPRALAGPDQVRMARTALQAADYVSLRDPESVANLGEAAADVDIAVVPDTAASIAAVWPKKVLAGACRDLLDRKGAPPDARYLVIHPKQRAFDEPPEALAARIEAFSAAHGLVPMLIAISPCHDDQVAVRRLSRAMRAGHIAVDDPRGLTELAAAIANASLYVGASLHGFIVASSYGVPGVLVARPLLPKFGGFLGHTERPDDLVENWPPAFDRAAAALDEGPGDRVPAAVHEALDAHWDRIASVIAAGPSSNPGRTRLLRRYVQAGLTKRGWDWVMAPAIEAG
mgnify:CR=1 FL=1